eukprot:6346912-Prymnesium_polylepis.4
MNRPRIPKNEITRGGKQQHGASRHRIVIAQRTPVATPPGIALPESCLHFFAVTPWHHLQPTTVRGDVNQRHYALDALELRFCKGILIHVQSLCLRPPALIEPPRPPCNHGIHRDEKIGRRPHLLKRRLNPRQATHKPST